MKTETPGMLEWKQSKAPKHAPGFSIMDELLCAPLLLLAFPPKYPHTPRVVPPFLAPNRLKLHSLARPAHSSTLSMLCKESNKHPHFCDAQMDSSLLRPLGYSPHQIPSAGYF